MTAPIGHRWLDFKFNAAKYIACNQVTKLTGDKVTQIDSGIVYCIAFIGFYMIGFHSPLACRNPVAQKIIMLHETTKKYFNKK